MKWLPALLLFLVFCAGVAGAGAEQQINERLKAGGTVYLQAGVYEIEGPIIIGSNTILTGDPDAIIKVSATSSQYFTGMTGIISSNGPVDNVEISGFQIDGNCDELPASYANSAPQYDHDAERAIIINGYTNQFCNNIVVKGLTISDCFSDGVHIRFANNVLVYDNFISNCQHEGVFFTSIINGEIYNNKIAGITSDNLRIDNGVNNKVHDNVLFSYTGNHNNGAYQTGQNGVQIANAGSSHGYDASSKPTTTMNVEVFDNVFANDVSNTIWVHSIDESQVYLHDNRRIDGTELANMGIPVEVLSGNISYTNPPTKEMSDNIFGSIITILNTEISDSGYVNQSSVFNPDKTLISKGTTSAWIDVVGYTGEIKIGNDTYIPKPANESAVVVSGTQSARDRVVSQESSKRLTVSPDNNLTVDLEVKTTYNIPLKNKITVFGKSLNYTTYKTVSENTTFTKTFKAPLLFPAFSPPNVSVVNYNRSHAVVYVPELAGIVKIEYRYKNSTATEYRLIGYVGSAVNGFKSTEYEITTNYLFDTSGMMSISPNGLYIKEKNFDLSKLNVIVVTPYDNFHISHFEYKVVEDDHLKFFKWGFVGILGYFFIFGRAIHKIIYSVVGKWV